MEHRLTTTERAKPSELQGCGSSNGISIYTDQSASEKTVQESAAMITTAFANIFGKKTDKDIALFTHVLEAAVRYCKMTDQQLKDAVMECICHKRQYGEFQISDITDFDRKFKFYSYKAICDKDGYFPIERNGEVYWVQGAELAQYGYKVENKKIVRI